MTPVDTRTVAPSGPETEVLSTDQLIKWRWRALSQQLPAAEFPAGSHAPALVYLWATMLIAVATVLGFAVFDRDNVPTAVRESQQDLMRKVARSLALSVTGAGDAFDRVAAGVRGGTPATAATLAPLTGEDGAWAGAAVLQPSTRQTLATSAQAVPLNLLPPGPPADGDVAVMTPDGPAIIRATTIGPDLMLVGLQPLHLRSLRLNPDARQGIYVLTGDGQNYLVQGVDAVPAVHRPEIFRGVPGLQSSRSETLRVREWAGHDLVLSAAPVADSGFVVASVIRAEITDGTSLWHGALLALAVALTAMIAYAMMRAALVTPLQRLLNQAKRDACGAVPDRRPNLRIVEAYRIADALAVSRELRVHGRRWRPAVTHLLSVAAVVALLGASVAVGFALTRPVAELPVQLSRDEESRVEAVSTTLGNALDTGLRTVTNLVGALGTATGGTVEAALNEALDGNHRLRGLYLVEPDGTVSTSTGRPSLRSVQPVPGQSGVVLDRAVERLPVAYAYHQRTDGRAIVAEYDVDYLLRLVRGMQGRVVVVDPDLRTVLDSEGYQAFQPLRDRTARDAAVAALTGETVSRVKNADGQPALVAGTAVGHPTVAHLEWVVVVNRNAQTLQLPGMLERRWALLMAAATIAVLVVTLVWQHFIFVGPLRRLAAAAGRIRAGDFDQPVTPQRHDDIGAIAMCLEICRQVRHTGSARFGGAVRLRGSAADFTAVLPSPAIPAQRRR